MKGKIATLAMLVGILLAAAIGGYGWHRHARSEQLWQYESRLHALEIREHIAESQDRNAVRGSTAPKQRVEHLNSAEQAELAELRKRIGEMRADGVKTGDDW